MKSKLLAGRSRGARAAACLLAGIASGAISSAFAQDASPPVAEEAGEIIVTGSRIARDVTDASTPLAIIGAEEIKLSGAMTIDKVLNDQPQFVAATNGGISSKG